MANQVHRGVIGLPGRASPAAQRGSASNHLLAFCIGFALCALAVGSCTPSGASGTQPQPTKELQHNGSKQAPATRHAVSA